MIRRGAAKGRREGDPVTLPPGPALPAGRVESRFQRVLRDLGDLCVDRRLRVLFSSVVNVLRDLRDASRGLTIANGSAARQVFADAAHRLGRDAEIRREHRLWHPERN